MPYEDVNIMEGFLSLIIDLYKANVNAVNYKSLILSR